MLARRRKRYAKRLERAELEAAKEGFRKGRKKRLRDTVDERDEQNAVLQRAIFKTGAEVIGTREVLLREVERLRAGAQRRGLIKAPQDPSAIDDEKLDKPGFNRMWRNESQNFAGIVCNVRVRTTLRTDLDLEEIVFKVMPKAKKLWHKQVPERFYAVLTILSLRAGDGYSQKKIAEERVGREKVPLIQSFLATGNALSLEGFEIQLRALLETLLDETKAAVVVEAVTIKNVVAKVPAKKK